MPRHTRHAWAVAPPISIGSSGQAISAGNALRGRPRAWTSSGCIDLACGSSLTHTSAAVRRMRAHGTYADHDLIRSRCPRAIQALTLKDQTMRLVMLLWLFLTALTSQASRSTNASAERRGLPSQPCAPSQRMIRQWKATPHAPPPGVRLAATPATPRPKAVRRFSTRTARPRPDPADARCNAARAGREAKLKAVGLKRTFDLLRRLDDAVHDACK